MSVGPLTFMVVGDSISQGIEGDFTWRYRLYEHLSAQNLTPEFVGPWFGTNATGSASRVALVGNDGCYRPEIAFSSAHLCGWGWMLAYGAAVIAEQVCRYKPAYLLVELGFNDVAWNLGTHCEVTVAEAAGAALHSFVASARAANPALRILLADLPQRAPLAEYPALPRKLATYNHRLDGYLHAVNAGSQSPAVVRVPLAASFDHTRDAYDGVHPNVHGEYVIAKAYADQLASSFGVGAPLSIPRSLACELAPGPTAAVSIRIERDWTTYLSWTRVFGAAGFWIWARDTSQGEHEFRRLPWPVTRTGWQGPQLSAGQRIEFKVQTMRGHHVSAFSQTVTLARPDHASTYGDCLASSTQLSAAGST
jgi:lysophospholipase L1-like esterase